MERRKFLTGLGLGGAAVAASSLPAPAIASGKRRLKLVTTWPKNFPGLGTAAAGVARRITKASDGRLTVKVYAAGELVPAFECFDAVSQGAADMYHAAEYYWQGKSKAFNFFTAVPFGLLAHELDAWILHGGGQKLWDDLSGDFNVKSIICANTGVQWGGWFNKEINQISDLKGLKMRMPGIGGEVLRQVGATAVALPGGEIMPALQSGAIDATEWVGPWNDLAFGFYKAAKYYYSPGFHEPGASLALGINREVWDSFSKSDRALITACAIAENNSTYAEYTARNSGALDTLVNKHKVQLRTFSDDVLRAFGEAAGDVLSDVGTEGGLTKEVLDSFLAFRKRAINLSRYAEEPYMRMRRLDFKFPG